MRKNKALIRSILFGILGGIFLSIPVSMSCFLIASDNNSGLIIWIILAASACAVAGVASLVKNTSLLYAFLREVIMILFCYLSISFFATIRLFENIFKLLNVAPSLYDNLVTGFPPGFIIIAILIECAVIDTVLLVVKIIRHIRDV